MTGVWVVQEADGSDQRVDGGALATDQGALVALSEDGVLLRAWAPGHWRTVRYLRGAEAHPAGTGRRVTNVVPIPRG